MNQIILNVPLEKQNTNYSCGAAAITMLIRYHKKKPPKDLIHLCSPHDGLQPDAIKSILIREFGHALSATITPGILTGFIKDKKPVLCPITPKDYNESHWVIVTGYDNNYFYYNCPINGKSKIRRQQWNQIWIATADYTLYSQWAITSWNRTNNN